MGDGKAHTFVPRVSAKSRVNMRACTCHRASPTRGRFSPSDPCRLLAGSLTRPSLLRSCSFPLLGTTAGRRSARRSRLPLATRGKQSKRPSVESGQPVCPPAAAETRPALVLHTSLFLSLSRFSFARLSLRHPSRFSEVLTAPRVF